MDGWNEYCRAQGRKKKTRKNAKLNILKVSRKVVKIVEIYRFVSLTPSPCYDFRRSFEFSCSKSVDGNSVHAEQPIRKRGKL